MQTWIGTSGFQYPEWKGTFYPEKMPASKMLPFYAEHFSTTEINYSFRRIPSEKTISNWAGATPPDFKFTFKAPQSVTHFKRLRECESTIEYFYSIVGLLDHKFGAVLFQLPPDFQKDIERLQCFLEILPASLRAAFEFRNDSWFDNEVFDVLASHNAALCIAESERIHAPKVATSDFGYLRLRREDYSECDVETWADLVRGHEGRWREAFIYFKHEESGVGPKFAGWMQRALQERLPAEY